VNSSKQDQIHTSIDRLHPIALMNGTHGHGQVVVIGTTDRSTAIESILHCPGRFDRGFYFLIPYPYAEMGRVGDWG